jgi:hypothetical protein
MYDEEEPQSKTPEEPRDGQITGGYPNTTYRQEAFIPSLYALRKTVRRRDGRRQREQPAPPKPVISIIVCNSCYTVIEIEFAHCPTIDEISAARIATLQNHQCRPATTAALRRIGAGA